MGLNTYLGLYSTDNEVEVNLIFKYDTNKNPNDKVKIGKFDNKLIEDGYKVSPFTRKQLKPRTINHVDFGTIIFQNHKDWVEYIKSNKKKIKSYQGEKLGCQAIAFLL